MIIAFFTDAPAVTDFAGAKTSDTAKFGRWFRLLLEAGIYWPPAQFEAAFLSAAMSEGDLSNLQESTGRALAGL